LKKFISILEKIQMSVGIFFLVIFFLTILIQITTRHLGISVIWTVEVSTNAFIWSIFMGAAVMVNRREHFNFNIIERNLKGKRKAYLSIFNNIVLILFNIAIFLYGIEVVKTFWDYNWTSLPQLKMGYVWIVLPIMASTMIIYTFSHLLNHIKVIKSKEG